MTIKDVYVYVDHNNAHEMRELLVKYNQPIGDIDVSDFTTMADGYHYLVYTDDDDEWFVDKNPDVKTRVTLSQLERILKGESFTLPKKWCVEDCDIVTEYARNRFNQYIGNTQSEVCLYVNEGTNDYWFINPQLGRSCINIEEYTKISLEEFKEHVLKVSPENLDTLPKKWCIKTTKENIHVLGNWRTDGPLLNGYIGWYLHTPMNGKNGYNIDHIEDGYIEITFEQFKKHILKQNNMITVSRRDLGRIHNIACSTWKTKIENLGSRNPFSETIEISQDEVDEMFKAATLDQIPVLIEIFGEQQKYLDVSKEGVGRFLSVRLCGEYQNKGFYLNDSYNWEIVKDNENQFVLIPTRK